MGAHEVVQQLSALIALWEDLGLIPRTHMMDNNNLVNLIPCSSIGTTHESKIAIYINKLLKDENQKFKISIISFTLKVLTIQNLLGTNDFIILIKCGEWGEQNKNKRNNNKNTTVNFKEILLEKNFTCIQGSESKTQVLHCNGLLILSFKQQTFLFC